ncbi:MAG: polyprenyl synthetase family protein, partial [Candidatus Faecousia sp.]|nr:polyprenyl synthetase family protein [Candidatus Faecousia sp.]
MKHFEERYADYRKKIENYLAGIYAPYGQEPQKLIFEAANYSLLAGGKRLRPIFVMDFCRMCGGEPENALPLAAAIEMVHTYS